MITKDISSNHTELYEREMHEASYQDFHIRQWTLNFYINVGRQRLFAGVCKFAKYIPISIKSNWFFTLYHFQ